MGVTAIPMLLSLYLSFTNYDILTPFSEVEWVGLANYERMFTADPSYWHAVRVTLTFALIAVPLKLAAALGVALLLNRAWRGVGAVPRRCSTCRRCSAAASRWPSSGSTCSTATARSTRC